MTSMGNAFRSRPRWRQRPRSRAFTSGAASSAMYSSTPPASHTGNESRHGVPLATDTATSKPIQLLQLLGKSKRDRKSTRLNSSHDQISYAVFCLKKKKKKKTQHT